MSENSGITMLESCYPYTTKEGQCYLADAILTSMVSNWQTNEMDMNMRDMVSISPVAGTSFILPLQANGLHDYSHGVYEDSRCCNLATVETLLPMRSL